MARLSVLIPICNVGKYLEKCLFTVMNQSYTDIEVICVNDGSTDNSIDIIRHFKNLYSNIKVIDKQNTGYGDSLNQALQMASGEYIGIVESDDYIDSCMYEQLMKYAIEYKDIDIVKSSYYAVEDNSLMKKELYDEKFCHRIITAKECSQLFSIPCNIWSAIYRRQFLIDNNINFLPTPGASYQDTSFYFKTMIMAKQIILTNEAYYYYRIDNAQSSVNNTNKLFYVCDEMNEIDDYMKKLDISDLYYRGVRHAFMFRAYLWNYNRLSVVLKSAFYQVMIKELDNIVNLPEFSRSYWTDFYWDKVHEIMQDKDRFFWNSVNYVEQLELNSHTSMLDIYDLYIEDYIKKQDKILIYGAGVVGKRVYDYLVDMGLKDKVDGYVVTIATDDIPAISECVVDRDETLLIIATIAKNHNYMLNKAHKYGFKKIIRYDAIFAKKIKERLEL